MRNAPILVTAVLLLGGCRADAPRRELAGPPAEITAPAGAPSGEPFLATTADDRILLSWIERTAERRHAVRFASWDGSAWSEPRTIAEDSGFFVNWADFPSILDLGDGRMAAHWLERSGEQTYAYGVRIARSADGGATWSTPVTPHDDGTPTEHGFVSLFPVDGNVGAVWLDGRLYDGAPEGAGRMTLRFAAIDEAGAVAGDALLDERTCDCCQTDAAWTDSGLVVVYRDRSPAEIRDIAVVRRVDGEWTGPAVVHDDGWEIPGCPVNGPAIAAEGAAVAVAWFTAAGGTPRVRVGFSTDAGASFGAPVQVDDGAPVGRVDLIALGHREFLVSWLERTADEEAEVRARVVDLDGYVGEAITVSRSSAERSSGFPRMARRSGEVIFAWTDPSGEPRIRTARLPLPGAT